MYPNIEIDNDHMVYMSRMCSIVDSPCGYQFLIAIPDNFEADQSTRTYEVHLLPHLGYTNRIVFYTDSLFMSHHFQSWAASNRILLEPSTACQQETDGQTEIVSKEVLSIVRAYELEVDQCVRNY